MLYTYVFKCRPHAKQQKKHMNEKFPDTFSEGLAKRAKVSIGDI